jgi:Trypsin-co-occurring domain 1
MNQEEERELDIKVQVVAHDGGEVFGRKTPPPSFASRAGELGDSLNEVAGTLRGRLHEIETRSEDGWDLDEIQLSFSLDLAAEAGVILARASTKAGFQASMTWKRASATPHQ